MRPSASFYLPSLRSFQSILNTERTGGLLVTLRSEQCNPIVTCLDSINTKQEGESSGWCQSGLRVQLFVCVPIVPIPFTGQHKVKPSGDPCEIWRNVNTRTQLPVGHVGNTTNVALLPWTMHGQLSPAAKQFMRNSFYPEMRWNEMEQKLESHFPVLFCEGPKGIKDAAHNYFKQLKKRVPFIC